MKLLFIKLLISTARAADTIGGDLKPHKSLDQILQDLISEAKIISLWVGVIMIIVGGYFFLTAGGNEKNIELGKKTITYALVGIIIVFLASGVIAIVKRIVGLE